MLSGQGTDLTIMNGEKQASRGKIRIALGLMVVFAVIVAMTRFETVSSEDANVNKKMNLMNQVKDLVGAEYDDLIAQAKSASEQKKWEEKKAVVVAQQQSDAAPEMPKMGVVADVTNTLQGFQTITVKGLYYPTPCYPGCGQPTRQCTYLSKPNPAGGWFKIIGVKVFFDPNYLSISGMDAHFADGTVQSAGTALGRSGTAVEYKATTSRKMTGAIVVGRNGYYFGMTGLFDDDNVGTVASFMKGTWSSPWHTSLGSFHQGTVHASESTTLAIEDIKICFDNTYKERVTNLGFYFGIH